MRQVMWLRNSTVRACFRHVTVVPDTLTKGWVKKLGGFVCIQVSDGVHCPIEGG